MADPKNLQPEFPRVQERDWRRLVEQSLRERQIEALASRTDDGILLAPVHGTPQMAPKVSGRPPSAPWIVTQRLDDPDPSRAERKLTDDLGGGVTGIALVFAGSAAAARTGFGIAPKSIAPIAPRIGRDTYVLIDAGEASYSIYDAYFSSAEADISIAYDPLAQAAARGGFDRPLAAIERDIVDATKDFVGHATRAAVAVADGRIWAAAGASEAQEIAAILGSLAYLVRLLTKAGVTAGVALQRIAITVDAGVNQTLTIAKVRAVRLVHARFAEAFRLPPLRATIHAETSWRMMTRYDVHTNILRAASAAFAAGIGGADSVTVLPFTIALGPPDGFARRVARNSQILLIEEAGITKVADPGAGSGAIESLTNALAEAAWEKFREIEATGGLLAGLRSGSFQGEIAAMRTARADKVAHREIGITGISQYPTLDEPRIPFVLPRPENAAAKPPAAEAIIPLVSTRLAEPFEALRDRAAALGAKDELPEIFSAEIGNSADLSASRQAADNFFAMGGVRTRDAGSCANPEALVEAFVSSGLRSACIVSPRGTAPELVDPIAAALRARGAVRVYLASESCVGDAESFGGVDAVIGDGIDAVELLDDLLGTFEHS